MISELRAEVIESQKAQTELLKWKLILVAAIGAAGFGLGAAAQTVLPRALLFALIPLVCLYVDALCYHNEIRILTIARFLRTQATCEVAKAYEKYCKEQRRRFSLPEKMLVIMTGILSLAVAIIGCSEEVSAAGIDGGPALLVRLIILGSGVSGIGLSWKLRLWFRRERCELDNGCPRGEA